MYVYSYQKDITNPAIEQRLFCELKDGGLSSYTSSLEIAPKFANCMNEASFIVPLEKRKSTHISLLSTAGMRLLEIRNKPLTDQLIQGVQSYFNQSGYLYESFDQVQILSGAKEASFAWIASNFLLNKFDNISETVGIVDLGGSSSQIAFQIPKDFPVLNREDIVNFEISGRTYSVYSHSHLCYGTTSFLAMYRAYILRKENYTDPVNESCLPKNYSIKVLGQDFLEQACVNGMIYGYEHNSFTIDALRVKPSKKYDFDGISKKNKCREEVETVIPNSKCSYGTNQCSLEGVYMPPLFPSTFLALGNFYEAIDYTEKLLNINVKNNMTAFSEATYKICSMDYVQLQHLNTLNDANVGNSRIAKLCLEHVYIIRLLNFYKIQSLSDINAVEQINGIKISWTLGALINRINSDIVI
jgi:Golgi nucleoside diphosphatase